MGGGKDNHDNKGCYLPTGYPPVHSAGSYTSAPPVAYPYPYAQHVYISPPPSGPYAYPPPMYSPHGGYPPSGYPAYNQSVYTSMGGYPGASLYATQHHGHGSSMGGMLVGGAAAATATATAYGVHHLTHGHRPHGHHLGHFGKFKRHHHGHYGKFKHGKFVKHIGLGGKHGLLGWKHHRHGIYGGKYKRWK